MAPQSARNSDNEPVKRAEKKALPGMPVFMNTGILSPIFIRVVFLHKNEEAERESAEFPRKISDIRIAELFAAQTACFADKIHKCADNIYG